MGAITQQKIKPILILYCMLLGNIERCKKRTDTFYVIRYEVKI